MNTKYSLEGENKIEKIKKINYKNLLKRIKKEKLSKKIEILNYCAETMIDVLFQPILIKNVHEKRSRIIISYKAMDIYKEKKY